MIGFFTAIGWATLILVRVPAADGKRAARNAFYSLVSMAAWTAAAATLACVLVSATGLVAFDLGGVIALLWGWSAYQLARHFFVSYRCYRITIAFDCLLIAGSCAMLWVGARHGYASAPCLAVALIVSAVAMFAAIGVPERHVFSMRIDAKGLQFGLTNFLSGGIVLVIVPAAKAMCGASFAGCCRCFFGYRDRQPAAARDFDRAIADPGTAEEEQRVARRDAGRDAAHDRPVESVRARREPCDCGGADVSERTRRHRCVCAARGRRAARDPVRGRRARYRRQQRDDGIRTERGNRADQHRHVFAVRHVARGQRRDRR
ncbi:putative membrane protein [Burkholderia cepacia]|nr:putative membrane protein [Burkholderia cepacia]